ncbi:hypothetical protein BV25DRAFT_1802024 [Artomyces pyxidatus]|uniref:Uncharacterized protein n=1 Tax=Artomyces pyxidatus TaxID=48021 RepID=A0ACB8T568_9AGAM|nr:hypothetical protein BV25DRAFT_1802024 [Artomyces pyxidatus]
MDRNRLAAAERRNHYPPAAAAHYHPPPAAHVVHTSSHRGWAYSVHAQWPPSGEGHTPVPVNAAVSPTPHAQPPQVAHKVWLIDCRSCHKFLTNRGMKAVLLLRPHVPLYSTDALPINCSAHSATPPPLLPPPSDATPRTCECLTQTLCCHGCGNSVGYMIVIPCTRCMSTMSATNRTTNGHRFVFHSSEVVASERHYTAREPGILPLYTDPHHAQPASFLPSPPAPTPASPGSPSMPPLEPAAESPFPVPFETLDAQKPDPEPEPAPYALRAGDVLYWHHLARNGEIPGVVDDRHARGRRGTVQYGR